MYKAGDSVIHSTYGNGKIIAIEDKGLSGTPCFYYVIETGTQTLWVQVDEIGSNSLHLPVSGSDFKLLINLLRSRGAVLSNNSFQRHDQLAGRMQTGSLRDLCLVIRDLTFRSRSKHLSNSDVRVLNQAKSLLLDEWHQCLGITREKAGIELGWILREILN